MCIPGCWNTSVVFMQMDVFWTMVMLDTSELLQNTSLNYRLFLSEQAYDALQIIEVELFLKLKL